MEKNDYIFEVLCIDPNGQTSMSSDKSIAHGLLFNEKLWKEPKEIETNGKWKVIDDKQEIQLSITSIDTSNVLTGLFDAAFILKVKGANFDELEDFRLRLLKHLRSINFKHIRVLADDISKDIANQLYPEINKVENLLRRYLTKFFIQRVGLEWWEATAPRTMNDKVKTRRNDRKDEFSNLVDFDVSLADFDDLGELIYKQSSGFNNPDAVIAKVVAINSIEALENFKSELQGNYTKYFKESFRDKDFEPKWKELFRIRNKVAHHGLFFKRELETGIQLSKSLCEIIGDAESKIDEIVFSVEEKVAIRNATIEAISIESLSNLPIEKTHKLPGVKVVGKIELPEADELTNGIITEEQFLIELERAESTLKKNNLTYVGLKAFVTKLLGNKGYTHGPTYALANILQDRDIIELYEVKDDDNFFTPKAIRIKR